MATVTYLVFQLYGTSDIQPWNYPVVPPDVEHLAADSVDKSDDHCSDENSPLHVAKANCDDDDNGVATSERRTGKF